MFNVTHPNPRVYLLPSDLKARFISLLAYSLRHQHSRQWIGAISAILAREELADER
jgi:hypothetical protein